MLLLFSSYLENWLNKTKGKCEARSLLRKPPHVTSICWLGPAAPEQVVPERLSARLNINSPGKQPRGRWLEGEMAGGGTGPRRAEPSQLGASGSLLKINSAGAQKHQHRLKRRCLNDTCASHPAASARHTEAAGGPPLRYALRRKKKKCMHVYMFIK